MLHQMQSRLIELYLIHDQVISSDDGSDFTFYPFLIINYRYKFTIMREARLYAHGLIEPKLKKITMYMLSC